MSGGGGKSKGIFPGIVAGPNAWACSNACLHALGAVGEWELAGGGHGATIACPIPDCTRRFHTRRQQCGHMRAHSTAQKEAVQTAAHAQAYEAANAGIRGIAEALGTSLGNQISAMDKNRLHQIRDSSNTEAPLASVPTQSSSSMSTDAPPPSVTAYSAHEPVPPEPSRMGAASSRDTPSDSELRKLFFQHDLNEQILSKFQNSDFACVKYLQ